MADSGWLSQLNLSLSGLDWLRDRLHSQADEAERAFLICRAD